MGQSGLPLRLEDVEKVGVAKLPTLPPELLFITKAKRAAALVDSNRPKSIAKLQHDEQDLGFLLGWMKTNDQTMTMREGLDSGISAEDIMSGSRIWRKKRTFRLTALWAHEYPLPSEPPSELPSEPPSELPSESPQPLTSNGTVLS